MLPLLTGSLWRIEYPVPSRGGSRWLNCSRMNPPIPARDGGRCVGAIRGAFTPRWKDGLLTEPAVGGPALKGDIFAFGPAVMYGDLIDVCSPL